MAFVVGLVLILPMSAVHGAAHGPDEGHLHHAPPNPETPDLSPDNDDIACNVLCTGPLLRAGLSVAHGPAPHSARPRPDTRRIWSDWARPTSPPPKYPV